MSTRLFDGGKYIAVFLVDSKQLPYGLFIASTPSFKYKYENFHVKHRELIMNWAGISHQKHLEGKECWNECVVPWIETKLKPLHKSGIRAFVFIDHTEWYQSFNAKHYSSPEIVGPYILHYSRVINLDKDGITFNVKPAHGIQVQVIPNETMGKINKEHSIWGFDEMFENGKIRKFPSAKNSHYHRFIVMDSLILLLLLNGRISHDNRPHPFCQMDEPKHYHWKCFYCPFIPFGIHSTMTCPEYRKTHCVTPAIRPELINQYQRIRQEWSNRYLKAINDISGIPNTTLDMLRVDDMGYIIQNGIKLLIRQIHFNLDIPMLKCKFNPYIINKEMIEETVEDFTCQWNEIIGGSIASIQDIRVVKPGQINHGKRTFRFIFILDCHVLPLVKPGDKVAFQLDSVILKTPSNGMENGYTSKNVWKIGWKMIHYGDYVQTPLYLYEDITNHGNFQVIIPSDDILFRGNFVDNHIIITAEDKDVWMMKKTQSDSDQWIPCSHLEFRVHDVRIMNGILYCQIQP